MVYRGTWNMDNMELENMKVKNLSTDNIVADDDLEAKDDLKVWDDANIGWDLTVWWDIDLAKETKIVCSGTWDKWLILKNLKNTTGTLSWDAKVIEIDIGGTPYYFSVYPTKS